VAERCEMGLTDTNSCAVPVGITRIRAEIECECAHGYVCGWTGRAEGFDSSGVRACNCANVAAWPRGRHKTDGACMAMTQRRELNEQI
jgi:hypothetical protein